MGTAFRRRRGGSIHLHALFSHNTTCVEALKECCFEIEGVLFDLIEFHEKSSHLHASGKSFKIYFNYINLSFFIFISYVNDVGFKTFEL